MAADAILSALGRTGSYAEGPFAEGDPRPGDLYEMLYPAGTGAEAEILYQPGLRFTHLNDPREGNAISIRTEGGSSGSLYCWRDSFGIALYPYLADAFAQASFSRSDKFRCPEGDYNVLILEIVERSIPSLVPEIEN